MLYLVGETPGFASYKAARERGQGKLAKLAHGVYCDEDDLENLAGFMKDHAVRIANYLYPDAVLTHASAYYKGAVEAGNSTAEAPKYRLFLAGKYVRSTKLQYLEIVQSDALTNPALTRGCIQFSDGLEVSLGPMRIQCATDELVFLQNFGRRRYNLERFLTDRALLELRKNLEARHDKELPGRLRAIADATQDYSEELDRALAYLRTPIVKLEEPEMTVVHDFTVAWNGRPIAKLTNNGVRWNFDYNDGWLLPITLQKFVPGEVPQFIPNLFLEGYGLDRLHDRLENDHSIAAVLGSSERYLSHIAIVQDPERLKALPPDVLHKRLQDCTVDGEFRGKVRATPSIGNTFIAELNDLILNRAMPRISGTQAKLPMYIDDDGIMQPAFDKPFTHILKLPGLANDPQCVRGGVEWACLTLARAAGVKTVDFAMYDWKRPNNQPGLLCYLTERFDVPTSAEDSRLIVAEDLVAALGLSPRARYGYDKIKRADVLADHLREFSTNPKADLAEFFRQLFVSYLLENGDQHLKNFCLIKDAKPMLDGYKSIRLAPAYDIMNTSLFMEEKPPVELRGQTMVLYINGKTRGHPEREDWLALAQYVGLEPGPTEQLMDGIAACIATTARTLAAKPPAVLALHPKAHAAVMEVFERATWRCHEWLPSIRPGLEDEPEPAPPKRRKAMAPA